MRVKVITDTASVVPVRYLADLPIATVPLWLHLGESSYRDGVDLGANEFYRRLIAGEAASTSSPSPGDFLRAYEEAAAEGFEAIFVVTVTRQLSVIFDAARAATFEFDKVEAVVFDSGTAIASEALVVIEAARAASRGADLAEVRSVAERVAGRVDLCATLDTLRFLHRSGRVNLAQYWAGTTLRVKPVFRLHHGRVSRVAVTVSQESALDRIAAAALAGTGSLHAGIFHAGAADRAAQLEARLRQEAPEAELFVTAFSPALGAHTGPGVVGVGWWWE